MNDILAIIASAIVLVNAHCDHPTKGRCPPGRIHDGVRLESGRFDCVRARDLPRDSRERLPGFPIAGRIYCNPPELPTQVDSFAVRCKVGHVQDWDAVERARRSYVAR